MPQYDFWCDNCEAVIEIEKSMSDPNPESCPKCKSDRLRRLFSIPSIHYANRPPWTYKECLRYKYVRKNGGPYFKVDPSKHGDLGSWHSPGEIGHPEKPDHSRVADEARKRGYDV